jgi:hypothetical protein
MYLFIWAIRRLRIGFDRFNVRACDIVGSSSPDRIISAIEGTEPSGEPL